jgi:hypothetical protein
MYGASKPFNDEPLDDIVWADDQGTCIEKPPLTPAGQHRMDSFMESLCNIAVGFIISWCVWVWVVAPLFNYHNDAGTSFLITSIFTVTSLIRQYVLRRVFDGKTIWETIRAKIAR